MANDTTPSAYLDLGLEDTHVLVTGGTGLIGRAVVNAFLYAGANVSVLDINAPTATDEDDDEQSQRLVLHADVSSEESIEDAWAKATARFGPVACCVALASLDLSVLPHVTSAADMGFEQFMKTLEVNVGGSFLTARAWLRGLREAKERDGALEGRMRNVGFIIVGSESGRFGERGNPDYAASKSAVQGGLLQSLKADVVKLWKGARVNAVAPGPVDTARFQQECKDDPEEYWRSAQATTALGKPVPVTAVARTILYLASESWSGSVHGQVINVDGGKQGKVIWTKEEASNQ
ncbi:NAD-P-binding protein [Saccharata proteae CBS 121410]|uniref:NAD-P-binding protein n=1 Tax=Saccharata proteae CBS 121410 TaxID=1314787 RepID=A0A9P4HZT8_9PEZI|nr:NAD-P-binding protein [Saccharata proteae CBS 121410]